MITVQKAPTVVMIAFTLSSEYTSFMKKIFGQDTTFIKFNPDAHQPCNLVLLTGGADVNPKYYREKIGNKTYVNEERDVIEKQMCSYYSHIPKLGICRGAQLLTVLAGGKLVQHVNGHNGMHNIQTAYKMAQGHFKSYPMSSSHHQMMYPFNMHKNHYKLLAWSEYYQSSTYLNGNNVEIALPEDFLEPEVVYYNNIKSLCIQGHPEYNEVPEETFKFVEQLIKEYLL